MINCKECNLFNVCPRVTTRQDLICEHYERIRPRTEYTNAELYKLIDRLTRDCIGVDFYARDLSIQSDADIRHIQGRLTKFARSKKNDLNITVSRKDKEGVNLYVRLK